MQPPESTYNGRTQGPKKGNPVPEEDGFLMINFYGLNGQVYMTCMIDEKMIDCEAMETQANKSGS